MDKKNHNGEFNIWKGLFGEIYSTKTLNTEIFHKHYLLNINKIYGKKDIWICQTHNPLKCKFNGETQLDDGMSLTQHFCYCKNPLIISRLKYDLTRYKLCHCGIPYGYTIYNSGIFLGVCSDPLCLCTHEVNQQTQKPFGYPASIYCKSLRLIIHEFMDKTKLEKKECYNIISKITNKVEEQNHISKFGVSECTKVLEYWQNYLLKMYHLECE